MDVPQAGTDCVKLAAHSSVTLAPFAAGGSVDAAVKASGAAIRQDDIFGLRFPGGATKPHNGLQTSPRTACSRRGEFAAHSTYFTHRFLK
jgi:hypothetical protein